MPVPERSPGYVRTATFPWGRRKWAQPSRVYILVCYLVAVESVVVFEWQLNFAHWDVGRIPVVVSEVAGVSFCFRIFGLPPGFQQHSTPAPAPATGHSQCIRSPLAGGEYT